MRNLLEFLKIISDETRLRILVLLSNKEMCVCEICEILDESQPKISRHLARLREAGLVRDDRQGQWVFYYTNLEKSIHQEIMESIVSRREDFPKLEEDIKRFKEKNSEGSLCTRNLKEEWIVSKN